MTEPYEITLLKIRTAALQDALEVMRRDLRHAIAAIDRLSKERGDEPGTSEPSATLHVAERD